jgi:ABC-type transport system substrate-binding protein
MLVSMFAAFATIPNALAAQGPLADVLRHTVIKSPDAALIAMQTGAADFSPDQIRTSDIEKQDADGMLITQDLGFHMGFIAWNIRQDQGYRRGELDDLVFPPSDVHFRHAMIHCYDQLGIIPPIYGYIVTPVRSLVPPAESKYYNPNVPAHPYNPGSPFATTVWNPSTGANENTCAILRYAGYTFVDTAPTGVVNDADYWEDPVGDPLPFMRIFTPLAEVAPTSWQHGQEFMNDAAAIGLASTTANGNHGIFAEGWDFNEYLELVYDDVDFDAYMVFYSLGRVPDHLFTLLHSSQDCYVLPGARNAPGVWDATLDGLCEDVQYNLDTNLIETAAKSIQTMLYAHTDPNVYPNADNYTLAYMTLYSRSYFNAFGDDVTGVVKSPGYGSDNSWTFFNMMTTRTEDGDSVIVYINGDEPDSFNPCYATTVYEWNIIGATQDGLTAVNPYNHNDIPWIATDWTITEVGGGMEIDFTLRDDVYWQDGYKFEADDVEFALEFLRDHNVPRYASTWMTLSDVVVTDATHLTIEASEKGLGLFYDYSGLGPLLPMQIWDRTWASDQAVLDYNPEQYAYGTDMASGYSAGAWASEVPTNVFGTGPWVFQFYDAVNMYDDCYANQHYFLSHAEIAALKVEMFWEVGDHGKNGIVNVLDLTFVSFSYGLIEGLDPGFDPDADFNDDGIVDMKDISNCAYHLLWQKEYSA